MAIVGYEAKYITKGVVSVKWANVSNGDTGRPFDGARFPDKTVEFTGTFGTGGGISIKGGNATSDGGTFTELVDPQGNAIVKTAAAVETILENVRWFRPEVTGGDATTSLTTIMICGGAK